MAAWTADTIGHILVRFQVDAFVSSGPLAFEAGNNFNDTRDVDLLNSVKSSTTEES